MSLRVFADTRALAPGAETELDDAESHYLVRVRRARAGHELEVLDERAGESVVATLVLADPRRAIVRLGARMRRPIGPPAVTVLLGLPATDAAIEGLQHATALGAAEVRLVSCRFSPGKPPAPRRIELAIRAGLRQCGRPCGPTVVGPTTLADALASAPTPGYVADANGERLAGPSTPSPAVCVLVGPEGGLDDAERMLAREHGLLPLSLGPFTLRSELAVAAAVTLLRSQFCYSDGPR